MLPEHQQLTAEQRLSQGRCPECAVRLDGLDTLGERDRHWPKMPTDTPEHGEARRRYQMLTDLATRQQHEKALAAALKAQPKD